MIKSLMVLIFMSVGLFAQSGTQIFEAKCASCHMLNPPFDMSKKKDMKAPPMKMVSLRIKKMTADKDEFLAFVKDYIVNPSQEKGYCMPKAYKHFGTMPPIGKGMSKEEIEVVSNWLYDDFKGSWDTSKGARACEGKQGCKSGKKCESKGSGKCHGKCKRTKE